MAELRIKELLTPGAIRYVSQALDLDSDYKKHAIILQDEFGIKLDQYADEHGFSDTHSLLHELKIQIEKQKEQRH